MFKLKQSLGLIYIPSLNTHPVVALLSSCKKSQIWACTALYNFINKLKQTQSHNWAETNTYPHFNKNRGRVYLTYFLEHNTMKHIMYYQI